MRLLGNAWSHFVGDGVQPHVATPSEVVDERPHATLRRYLPGGFGDPILLVPPLAVTITCFDLRPQQSLAAFLVDTGRPVYVVDYGPITFADRGLGIEDWIDDILPGAIRRVSAAEGGRDVDVVTWSMGGTLSLLTAAEHPELPVRGLAVVGTPIDYSRIGYFVPIRAVGRLTGGHVVTNVNRLMGGVPGWAVQASFRATALQRELTKPLFVLRNLHDRDTLGRLEAVDRFIGMMPGYPGRLWSQVYHRIVLRNELADGRLTLGERVIKLADVRQDVLVVAGATDSIAPVAAVARSREVLTGARSLRFEIAPGSHLGVLTGPEARDTTWVSLRRFLGI